MNLKLDSNPVNLDQRVALTLDWMGTVRVFKMRSMVTTEDAYVLWNTPAVAGVYIFKVALP